MHLVIVGGSDAGISAALRARELDPETRVSVIVADGYANYSICGLPYFLSGEVPDWKALAHRTRDEIEGEGVSLLLGHVAENVDTERKVVHARTLAGESRTLAYDRLVIATGATPVRPDIEGLETAGVFVLRSMDDSFAIREYLQIQTRRSVVIVGGGYVGLELADAFALRGLDVHLVQSGPTLLQTVDPPLGLLVQDELERHRVKVTVGAVVRTVSSVEGRLLVSDSQALGAEADIVIVATGVTPSTGLGVRAGLPLGEQGALRVNRRMETGVADVYAAGDCAETWHRLLKRSTYMPLGTTAHKQGRVAGENAVGGAREFAGCLGTQVVKVCDLVAARTGLRDHEATSAGLAPMTVESVFWDHKVYYPNARQIRVRVTGDRQTGLLLGVQMVGHLRSEISKRIDLAAAAIFHGMRVDELNELDLSYTPPLSSPWDPIQMAAQAWVHQAASRPPET